ncbi:MAG: alkaline phosphatase [Phycisphaerales bacterium JB052]
MNHLTRRCFLSSSAFAAGAVALSQVKPARASHTGGGAGSTPELPDSIDDQFGRVRRVIFAVSDGMSMGTMTLADLYSKTVLGQDSYWPALMMRPDVRSGLCTTHSADSLVTDSAAASTTWSTGQKTYNKSIGYSVEREALTPILQRVHGAGYRTGLVTTAKVTDATPAGFIANVPVRTMEQEIAKQILDRAPNVVLGGGGRYFGEDARSGFGGRYITNPRAIGDARQRRSLVGIFSDDHIPYTLDRDGDDADLLGMTREAIEQLDYLEGGFLVQVEAARVDHAAHNNDAVSMILEQIEFDRTLRYLASYASGRDDTLLLVTTDHGNGNPGLNVYADSARRGLLSLANAQRSFDWIFHELRERDPELRNLGVQREVINFATGVPLKNADLAYLNPKVEGRANLFHEADSVSSRLSSLLANRSGVAFSSKNHTSDMVLFSAVGVGADLFPALIDNTDILPRLMHLMGVERMAVGSGAKARA